MVPIPEENRSRRGASCKFARFLLWSLSWKVGGECLRTMGSDKASGLQTQPLPPVHWRSDSNRNRSRAEASQSESTLRGNKPMNTATIAPANRDSRTVTVGLFRSSRKGEILLVY